MAKSDFKPKGKVELIRFVSWSLAKSDFKPKGKVELIRFVSWSLGKMFQTNKNQKYFKNYENCFISVSSWTFRQKK